MVLSKAGHGFPILNVWMWFDLDCIKSGLVDEDDYNALMSGNSRLERE